MPSQAVIQAGKELTRRNLYGHFVRQNAEIEDLKAQLAAKPTDHKRSRAKPKE